MTLLLNGVPRQIAAETVHDLLAEIQLTPHALLIEHNGLALRPEEWHAIRLAENDRLEIVRIVAGG